MILWLFVQYFQYYKGGFFINSKENIATWRAVDSSPGYRYRFEYSAAVLYYIAISIVSMVVFRTSDYYRNGHLRQNSIDVDSRSDPEIDNDTSLTRFEFLFEFPEFQGIREERFKMCAFAHCHVVRYAPCNLKLPLSELSRRRRRRRGHAGMRRRGTCREPLLSKVAPGASARRARGGRCAYDHGAADL